MATSRSIRFKISALLIVPLVTLVSLWALATSITTRESMDLLKIRTLYEYISKPGQDLNVALQREHLLSAEYMAAHTLQARTALESQRGIVGRLRQTLRRFVR